MTLHIWCKLRFQTELDSANFGVIVEGGGRASVRAMSPSEESFAVHLGP